MTSVLVLSALVLLAMLAFYLVHRHSELHDKVDTIANRLDAAAKKMPPSFTSEITPPSPKEEGSFKTPNKP